MSEKIKKGSVTKVIKRSQIKLNPYNPKDHTEQEIKDQAKNIRRVGYLGGIQWNERTGNLLDGHRRILASDVINHYDGTPETDYDVKVEAVDFDSKTELEQMTYEAVMNTKADFNKVAKYLNDIDPKIVGFNDDDIKQLQILQDDLDKSMEDISNDDDLFLSEDSEAAVNVKPVTELPRVEQTSEEIQKQHEEKPKMSVEEVKAAKDHCDNVAQANNQAVDTFIFIDFATVEQKMAFCDLLGKIPENNMRITGDEIMSMIE